MNLLDNCNRLRGYKAKLLAGGVQGPIVLGPRRPLHVWPPAKSATGWRGVLLSFRVICIVCSVAIAQREADNESFSACACPSVRTLKGFISWSVFTKSGTEAENPKRETSSLGQLWVYPTLLCPKNCPKVAWIGIFQPNQQSRKIAISVTSDSINTPLTGKIQPVKGDRKLANTHTGVGPNSPTSRPNCTAFGLQIDISMRRLLRAWNSTFRNSRWGGRHLWFVFALSQLKVFYINILLAY